MADWKETYNQLFQEADSAKEEAKASFLASLIPPNPSRVPENKRIDLIDAISKAQWKALLNHIGPFSSDGSVTFDVHTTDEGISQLDIRAMSAWEKISFDPSSVGKSSSIFTIVWQSDGATPARPIALWLKNDSGDTNWVQLWPVAGYESGIKTAWDVCFADLCEAPATAVSVPSSFFGKTVFLRNWDKAWSKVCRTFRALPYLDGPSVRSWCPPGLMITPTSGSVNPNSDDNFARVEIPIMPLLPRGIVSSEVYGDYEDYTRFSEVWLWFKIYATASFEIDSARNLAVARGPSGFVIGAHCGVSTSPFALTPTDVGSRVMINDNPDRRDNYPSLVDMLDWPNWDGKAYGPTSQGRDGTYKHVVGHPGGDIINAPSSNDGDDATDDNVLALRIKDFHHVTFLTGTVADSPDGTPSRAWPDRSALRVIGYGYLRPDTSPRLWKGGLGATLNDKTGTKRTLCAVMGGVLSNGVGGIPMYVYRQLKVEYMLAGQNTVVSSGGGSSVTAYGTVAISAGGVITLDPLLTNYIVTGTGPLLGISTAGIPDGRRVSCHFSSAAMIAPEGSPTVGAPILTIKAGMGAYQEIGVEPDGVVEFQLRSNSGAPYWKVIGGSWD